MLSPVVMLAHESASDVIASQESVLSWAEQQQLAQFVSPQRRQTYLQTRAYLRWLLARQYSCPPQSFLLSTQKQAPIKLISDSIDAQISVSHSRGLIVCALAQSSIGVDIEQIKPRQRLLSLAEEFMSKAEFQALLALGKGSSQNTYFYQLWSAKEAVFKSLPVAQQAGVQLDQICLSPDTITGHRVLTACYRAPDGLNFSLALSCAPEISNAPETIMKTSVGCETLEIQWTSLYFVID